MRRLPQAAPCLIAIAHTNIMDDLYAELEELQHANTVLLGLMAGGYAYFIRQFMVGHHSDEGLPPEVCEQTIIDVLKRIRSTQARFGYEYLSEVEAALAKMTQTVPLEPYLAKVPE